MSRILTILSIVALAVLVAGISSVHSQTAENIGIVFLFDSSGSMPKEKLDEALNHAAATLDGLPGDSYAGAAIFSTSASLIVPLEPKQQAVENIEFEVGHRTPAGGTDLIQALTLAEDTLASWDGKREIVVYGDGCADEPIFLKVDQLRANGFKVVYIVSYVIPYGPSCGGSFRVSGDLDVYYYGSPEPEGLAVDLRILNLKAFSYGGGQDDFTRLWTEPVIEGVEYKWYPGDGKLNGTDYTQTEILFQFYLHGECSAKNTSMIAANTGRITVNAEVDTTIYALKPSSQSNSFNAARNQKLTVSAPGVLNNDYTWRAPMTAVLKDAPQHGVANLALDGGFVYTPTVGFVGQDSFTYWTNDTCSSREKSAMVTINVTHSGPPVPTIPAPTPGTPILDKLLMLPLIVK